MYDRTPSPDPLELLRKSINKLIDEIKLQKRHNAIQDNQINDHGVQIKDNALEIQENKENINYLLRKIQDVEYLASRNEVLEYRENPYSLDGDANCNS